MSDDTYNDMIAESETYEIEADEEQDDTDEY